MLAWAAGPDANAQVIFSSPLNPGGSAFMSDSSEGLATDTIRADNFTLLADPVHPMYRVDAVRFWGFFDPVDAGPPPPDTAFTIAFFDDNGPPPNGGAAGTSVPVDTPFES